MAIDNCFESSLNYKICSKDKDSQDNRERFERAKEKYARLKRDRKFSSGNRIAILCSSSDGNGDRCEVEAAEHVYVGMNYKRDMGQIAFLIEDAGFSDLRDVLDDTGVRSIIVIGHASISTWMTENCDIDCFDVSDNATHLKRGFFAKLGCNDSDSEGCIPLSPNLGYYGFNISLGYFAVKDRNKIYEARMECVTIPQMMDPANFVSHYKDERRFHEEFKRKKQLVSVSQ